MGSGAGGLRYVLRMAHAGGDNFRFNAMDVEDVDRVLYHRHTRITDVIQPTYKEGSHSGTSSSSQQGLVGRKD